MVDDYNYKEVLRKLKIIGKTMKNYNILILHKSLTITAKNMESDLEPTLASNAILSFIFLGLDVLYTIDTSFSSTNIINDLGYIRIGINDYPISFKRG